eukprot:m.862691 g.862691  ORF g.862691 m.862691 type:complete len:51 (+) comp23536_c1_seq9:1087-1239(+)
MWRCGVALLHEVHNDALLWSCVGGTLRSNHIFLFLVTTSTINAKMSCISP